MNGQNRLSHRADRAINLLGIDLKSLEVRIDEHRQRMLPQHDIDRRDKCVGRYDHLIAGLDFQGMPNCGAMLVSGRTASIWVQIATRSNSPVRMTMTVMPNIGIPDPFSDVHHGQERAPDSSDATCSPGSASDFGTDFQARESTHALSGVCR